MKKLGLLVASAIVLFCSLSCEKVDVIGNKEEQDGLWAPMKMNKTELSFPKNGGQMTVTCSNYSNWWIAGAWEGEGGDDAYIFPKSSDPLMNISDYLDGEWLHAVVPRTGKVNTVIITINPNTSSQPRKGSITMECGDAFGYISINQQ